MSNGEAVILRSFRSRIEGSSHPGCCTSAGQPDLQPCIWFRRRLRFSRSIQKSKSKSVPTIAMSIWSKTTSISPFISGRCPTRWPRPGVLPTSDGYSLPPQATSPNTVGRNTRRIFQSINASFARHGSARISGHSRLTARSGRSRYPGVFAPMAPVSSTKRQRMALELLSHRFGRSGHWSIEVSSRSRSPDLLHRRFPFMLPGRGHACCLRKRACLSIS
jgi:hypothetical protein